MMFNTVCSKSFVERISVWRSPFTFRSDFSHIKHTLSKTPADEEIEAVATVERNNFIFSGGGGEEETSFSEDSFSNISRCFFVRETNFLQEQSIGKPSVLSFSSEIVTLYFDLFFLRKLDISFDIVSVFSLNVFTFPFVLQSGITQRFPKLSKIALNKKSS